MKKIEESKHDSSLYWSYSNQFREQICDWKEKKVCCCSQEQTKPNQWELLNGMPMFDTVNKDALNLEQQSKLYLSHPWAGEDLSLKNVTKLSEFVYLLEL